MEELDYKDLFRDAVLMMAEIARAAGFDPSDENVEPPDVVARVENQRLELERLRRLSGVLAEIATERERQVAKGYDTAHDDQHHGEDLAAAAADLFTPDLLCFTDLVPWVPRIRNQHPDRRERLIIALALGVAEVERLDRASTPTPAPE